MMYPVWLCQWLCIPDGPSDPFGSPVQVLVDSARVSVLVCALGVVGTSIAAGTRIALAAPQAARFLGLSSFALSAASAALEHMGDVASYRLPLNMVGCGLCLWGNVQFLRKSPHPDVE